MTDPFRKPAGSDRRAENFVGKIFFKQGKYR